MLQQQGNCDNKMQLIPSSIATNQWPQQKQIDIDDPKSSKAMEKKPAQLPQQQSQSQPQPQPQQQQLPPPPHLKCPRCDSSNTKFCYYNNYSLSQPRHFCKACKRYWTRGGTLRNVPVGGGCRKNKRVKRPSGTSSSSSSSLIDHHVPSSSSLNPSNPNIDLSSTSNHVNPMFYGLPTNPSELNLSFPRFNSRVSSIDSVSGHYDLQPQMNALGLGFSSGLMGSDHHHVPNSNSLLSSYPIFGSSTSSSTSPSMASIIASSLQQQRYMGLNSYDDEGHVNFGKEVKMEDNANRLDWNFNTQSQIGQIGSSDPNSLVWNTSSGAGAGAWLDPSNIGSSVPSLI